MSITITTPEDTQIASFTYRWQLKVLVYHKTVYKRGDFHYLVDVSFVTKMWKKPTKHFFFVSSDLNNHILFYYSATLEQQNP